MQEEDRVQLLEAVDTAAGKVVNKMIFGLRDSLNQEAFLECVAGLEKVYEEINDIFRCLLICPIKRLFVVGGGNIATRRIRTLLQFTRNITAIAPKSTMELQELGKTGYVNLITRPVKRSDFDMAYMVTQLQTTGN